MKIIIKKELCIGCGICTEMCSQGVLGLQGEGDSLVSTVINLEDCIECHACEVNCEYDAIQFVEDEN